ncbi:MAG: nucleotidyltransferase domain-containing protein, partial [Saprospiraceae bacterium]|nr:nucleotidyltransferase domain-containing protein [Saprospiraceae bacterium]
MADVFFWSCISGSKAYNLDTASSDTDIKGVFYLPKDMYFGLEYVPQISNESNDIFFYELGRYVELLLKNNPNILELLATPRNCILFKNPILDVLTPEVFLSKLCKETFANYAISQIKKARGLKKKINNPMDEKRKTILDFCFVIQDNGSIPVTKWLEANGLNQEKCGLSKIPNTKGMFALYDDPNNLFSYNGIISDELSNDVSLSSIPKGENPRSYLFCNLESYSVYCKEYREYWDWIDKRNDTRYQ